MKIKDQVFESDEVELDGNIFEGCTFKNCRMLFRGKGGGILSNCTFQNPQWVFLDHAQLTAQFMTELSNSGGDFGKSLILNTFPSLKEWIRPEILAKMNQGKKGGSNE